MRERVDKMRNESCSEDLTNPKVRMGVYSKAIRIRHKVGDPCDGCDRSGF